MAIKVGSLYVSLTAKTGSFVAELGKAVKSVEKTAAQIKRATREIGELGVRMGAAVGGAIALAANYDPSVGLRLDELKRGFVSLAIQVARLAIPAMEALSQALRGIVGWFQSLSPEARSALSTVIKVGGEFAVAAMLVSRLAGAVEGLMKLFELLALGGAGALLPFIAAAGAVWVLSAALREAFSEIFGTELTTSIQSFWNSFASAAKKAYEVVATWSAGFFEAISKSMSAIKNRVFDQIDQELSGYQRFGAMILKMTGGRDVDFGGGITIQKLMGTLQDFRNLAKEANSDDAWSKFLEGLKNTTTKTTERMKGDVTSLIETFKKLLGIAGKSGSFVGDQLTSYQKSLGIKAGLGDEWPEMSTKSFLGRPGLISANASDIATSLGGLSGPQGKRLGSMATSSGGLDAYQHMTAQNDAQAAAALQAMDSLIQRFAGKLGKLGDVLGVAQQGFSAGGVWGALLAVLGDLFSESSGFQNVIKLVDYGFKMISEVLGKLMKPLTDASAGANGILSVFLDVLGPIFDTMVDAIQTSVPLFQGFADLMSIFKPVIDWVMKAVYSVIKPLTDFGTLLTQGLFYSIKYSAEGILWAAFGVVKAWDWVVGALQTVLNALGDVPLLGGLHDFADSLEGSKLSVDGIRGAISSLEAVTWDSASAQAANAAATQLATDKTAALSEALTNVPNGFKVAAARFAAMDPIGGAATIADGGLGMQQSGLSVVVNIDGNVLSQGDFLEQLLEAMRTAQQRRAGAAGF
jgi:hypothetical protein